MIGRGFLAAALLAAGAGCVPAHQADQGETRPAAAAASAAAPAASPARQLVERKCSSCHGLDLALSGRRSAADWRAVVETMIGHGMVVTDQERQAIERYLAEPR